MIKNTLIALAAVVVAAAAAPAFADTNPVFGSTNSDQFDAARNAVVHELQQQGVDATSVDAWGNYIRADVRLANGTQVVRFFEPGSLQPVDINHLN